MGLGRIRMKIENDRERDDDEETDHILLPHE